MPGFLGQQNEFNAMYSKPILASRDAKSSSDAQGKAKFSNSKNSNTLSTEAGVLAMEALHRQVLPFILRRLKEDVLHDLPPKIIQDYHCEMSSLQRKLYHHFTNYNQVSDSSSHTRFFFFLFFLGRLVWPAPAGATSRVTDTARQSRGRLAFMNFKSGWRTDSSIRVFFFLLPIILHSL